MGCTVTQRFQLEMCDPCLGEAEDVYTIKQQIEKTILKITSKRKWR